MTIGKRYLPQQGPFRWPMYVLLVVFVFLSAAVFRVPGLAVACVAVVVYLLVSSFLHRESGLSLLCVDEAQRSSIDVDAQRINLGRSQWVLGTYVFTCLLFRDYWYSGQLESLSMILVVPLTLGAAIGHVWLAILGITYFASLVRARVSRLRFLDWLTLALNMLNCYVLFRGVKWFIGEL